MLSATDSEELFGVAMRSRSEEWEPNWSEEVLTRGATSQEILDEWRPECWFREGRDRELVVEIKRARIILARSVEGEVVL